jgi:hypothetical protein
MTSAMVGFAEYLKRVVDAITRAPGCAECEGQAELGWQLMPSGGIYGLCSRCADQHQQLRADQRQNLN